MIKEALSQEEDSANDSVDIKTMFLLAVATSIDALAVGVTYAFLQVQIVPAVTFIGVITFCLSVAGVKIGNVFGAKYKSKAELVGVSTAEFEAAADNAKFTGADFSFDGETVVCTGIAVKFFKWE